MMRTFYCTAQGDTFINLKPEQLVAILQEGQGLLWLDIADEPKVSATALLQDVFGFHPLAIDDALEESHAPKIDDWGEYLYLVLHAAAFDGTRDELLHMLELDIFVGRNYLVTYHTQPLPALEQCWQTCQRDPRQAGRGSAYLLYQVADALISEYMSVVEAFDDAIDTLEVQLFDDPQASILEDIMQLKRALLLMRRILAPQREVLNKLARGDYPVIPKEQQMFFRDVYDHLVRMYDIVDSMRDLVGGVLDTYLSVVNNRMNEVMKTLTIITTFFMPLSFVVGFFGMNFFGPGATLESWTTHLPFVLTMLGMALAPVGMYLWMRKRAWM